MPDPFLPEITLRKLCTQVEDIFHEGGPVADAPLRKGACIAVIHNPFAGGYTVDIADFMESLKPLGLSMAQRLIDTLGGADNIQGYGKGAIVGAAGELEHGALWHVPGGYAMRELLGTVGTNDAPRIDELLLALVMTTGARIHERVGGLQASEIVGADGLR